MYDYGLLFDKKCLPESAEVLVFFLFRFSLLCPGLGDVGASTELCFSEGFFFRVGTDRSSRA